MTGPDIETVVDAAALQREIAVLRRGIAKAMARLENYETEAAKDYLRIALRKPS